MTGERVQFDILVIEDNASDQRLIEEAFTESGSELGVQAVDDGEVAVDLLRRFTSAKSSLLPGVVLLDLHLPGRNGDAVLETIRTELDLECLPVIVLTRSDNTEDIARCYQAGANAYLQKPAEFTDWISLAETVEQLWFTHARPPDICPPDGRPEAVI